MSWDGKMYDKYRIAHTDGTPLKGKKYFVLRLDSDDPVEASRVAAAMRAYKGEPRNCDVGTWQQQEKRFESFCNRFRHDYCRGCSLGEEFFENHEIGECRLAWAQRKYESEATK